MSGKILLLGVGHGIELLAQILQVVGGFLGIALRIGLVVGGGGLGQATAQRRKRCGPLLIGGIELRPERSLNGPKFGEVRGQVVGMVAQLLREIAQLLGELRARIGWGDALARELVRQPIKLLGLGRRLLTHSAVLGDRRCLRVRQEEGRDKRQRQRQDGDGRPVRHPGFEQVRRDQPQTRNGVVPLATHQAPPLIGIVDVARAGGHQGFVLDRRWTSGLGHRPAEREGRGESVAELPLAVNREGGLAETGSRAC